MLFYTDEKLPYEPKTVPQWNPDNKCKFIKEHKLDYQEVAKKYGISELSAYNICVAGRAKPSLAFIRECCKDTNPIDFFTDGGEIEEPKQFTPNRGDIINIQGNILFVLSKKEKVEKDNYLTACPVIKQNENAIELNGLKIKGFINLKNIQTYMLGPRCKASFIETADEKITQNVMNEVREIFK